MLQLKLKLLISQSCLKQSKHWLKSWALASAAQTYSSGEPWEVGVVLPKPFLLPNVTKRLGGRMWIRSAVGAGTRITLKVSLPIEGAASAVALVDSAG